MTTEAAWNGTDQNSEFEDGNNYIFFNEKLSFGSSGVSDGFPLLMDQPGLGKTLPYQMTLEAHTSRVAKWVRHRTKFDIPGHGRDNGTST